LYLLVTGSYHCSIPRLAAFQSWQIGIASFPKSILNRPTMQDIGDSAAIQPIELSVPRHHPDIIRAPRDYFLGPVFAATKQSGPREVTVRVKIGEDVSERRYQIGGFHPMDPDLHPPALDVRHARAIFFFGALPISNGATTWARHAATPRICSARCFPGADRQSSQPAFAVNCKGRTRASVFLCTRTRGWRKVTNK
jgi:hypothetical protein